MEDLIKSYEKRGAETKQKIAKSHAKSSSDDKETGAYHGTYQFENLMLSYIRDGEVEKLRAFLQDTAQHRRNS